MAKTLEKVKEKGLKLLKDNHILEEKVTVTSGALSIKEAIGTPDETDFPIQQGKEKLMEANFKGFKGQAFTSNYGNFTGTLNEIFNLDLADNFNRAVFVSTLNAVCAYLGKASHTIHCKDSSPKKCSTQICDYIKKNYGTKKITIIGFQPTLAEALNNFTEVRLVDLDPENIGKVKRGVLIEGANATKDAIDWCDLLLVTGTTFANDSIDIFLTDKPVIFYGTTIAGAASLMGFERFCPESA